MYRESYCKAHVPLYERKEYERRVKAVLEGNILESTIRETAVMLGRQIDLLNGVPIDVLRNNSNKLVNQDMDVAPLEDINRSAENALHHVAGNIHDSSLMKRYVEKLTKKDREKWQLNNTMAFLWLMAAMPIFIMSVIWGINEVWAWMGRRKKKPKSRY